MDLVKAFDSLSILAVFEFLNQMETPLPIRLRFAFIKEFVTERLLDFSYDGQTSGTIRMEKGIRQGACDSSLLFALIVSCILFKLECSWKQRNFGVFFGKFAGNNLSFAEFFDHHFGHFLDLDVQNLRLCAIAFIDDLYLLCNDPRQAQIMLNELNEALSKAGLRLNADKCAWLCDTHSWPSWNHLCLNFNGVLKGPSKQIKVLGSIISFDSSETAAVEHRIQQAWQCFNRWQHILLSVGSVAVKISFWLKTVYRSLTWALQTTRKSELLVQKLATTQRYMMRKMLRLKRRPVVNHLGVKTGAEPWIDWQIRSLSHASSQIKLHNISIGCLLDGERGSWATKVSRFGLGPNSVTHLCKYVVAWRCKHWWLAQQVYNDLNWDVLKHKFPFKPRRWEDFLASDWLVSRSQALFEFV